MFIWSIKIDKLKTLALIGTICIVIVTAFLVFPNFESDVLNNDVDLSCKTTEEQIALLKSFGYEVSDEVVQVEEVIIPSEFDADYEEYNKMQNLAGFNLEKYKGKTAKKYTYKVTNYEGLKEDQSVVANILVFSGKAIGGDISEESAGGFCHGFIKE